MKKNIFNRKEDLWILIGSEGLFLCPRILVINKFQFYFIPYGFAPSTAPDPVFRWLFFIPISIFSNSFFDDIIPVLLMPFRFLLFSNPFAMGVVTGFTPAEMASDYSAVIASEGSGAQNTNFSAERVVLSKNLDINLYFRKVPDQTGKKKLVFHNFLIL